MAGKPNILLITADELRADALGCYGNKICRTPHLDALAENSLLFENSLTPNPICVPARASITTGNYSHIAAMGHKNNHGLIKDGQPKLAEHFASCGYETYACGKLHYVPYAKPDQPRLLHGFQHCDLSESGRIVNKFDRQGKARGLEDYLDFLADSGWGGWSRAHGIGNNDVRPCPSPLPAELHVDRWVADCTIRRLQEHQSDRADKPFLIWCSFPKPHAPFDPPAEYANMYDAREMPAPLGDASMLADRNPFLEYVRVTHGITTLSPAAMKVIKAYYYGLVTHQDAQVGRVMAALQETGQAENTIIIYIADHGEMLGDFGAFFKCSFLNGSLRVPLIVKAPGFAAGQRRKQLVGLQDILPTLAKLTDCPLNADVHGLDLTGVMREDSAGLREIYYSQCLGPPRQSAMVTDGRWKYIYSQEGPTEQLYDLAEDPDELNNLASGAANAKLVGTWREKLIAEARRLGDSDLLKGDGLVTSPLDRSAYAELLIQGLGWRWF